MKAFADQVYVPDTLAIAVLLQGLGRAGEGLGKFPLLRGNLPAKGITKTEGTSWFPRGAILGRDSSRPSTRWTSRIASRFQEYVSHSWYEYSGGKDLGLHPFEGETRAH